MTNLRGASQHLSVRMFKSYYTILHSTDPFVFQELGSRYYILHLANIPTFQLIVSY